MADKKPEIRNIGGREVKLSNPDKVYWPEDGITKGEMLDYYTAIAPVLLPYLKDRPVTMRVYPDGIRSFSYYRRDLPKNAPSWLRHVDYRPETTSEVIQLPLVDDLAGLLWLANQGSIEFHLWGSQSVPDPPGLDEPDMAMFDLDPGDKATFADAMRAGLLLREALEERGLRGYPKTSGGQGLHVFLPLAPGHTFDEVREWVKSLGEQLAEANPELVAVAHGPTHKGKQVTVDYAQNSVGRNTASPYTLRARDHAPASTPLTWDEVESGDVHPADLNIRSLPDRIERLGDLFAPVLEGGQRLPLPEK
jgi:bifunctional non-homologous end joining protein LigD